MKKIFISIIIILIIIIIVIAVKIGDNVIKAENISKFNEELESIYKDKTIYGADVLTIINKAIDNNKNYKIEKDENGNYISDNDYSLKIELILLSTSEDGKVNEITYPMEALERKGLDGFISSFSLTAFQNVNTKYNGIRKNFKSYIKTAWSVRK